ncbi:MAG: DUF1295 domain-containing protein [Clostridia bacterium]|nr:DUF1295 domain-containing protein [Clostridia bacterium]
MNIWIILAILFGISLLISALGFKKFLWFITVGYGFSIVGCGIAIITIFAINGNLNITGLIASILFMIYGVRLGGFLLIRDLKSASYKKALSQDDRQQKKYSVALLFTIWITVALLYTGQTSGVAFVLNLKKYNDFFSFNVFEIIGVCIMAFGMTLEGLADLQKSKYKKINPKLPAMNGLYKVQRCPNYCGEVLMWTGVFVFSMSAVSELTWWMWIVIVIAYLSITYIMLNGAKRIERKHQHNYGEIPEASEYMKKTPLIILIVFPIYSLKKVKFII